nr:hypothetical protein [Kribbella sp. VKM Ac-2527]
MWHQGAPGHGLHDRQVVRFGESERFAGSAGIARASAENEQRSLCGSQYGGRGCERVAVRARPVHDVKPVLEHRDREVVLLGLHVLRQRQDDGTRVSRIGEDAGDLRQGGHELLRAGDPVEVPRHRAERVVDRGGRVAEVLDLLQDGIRCAACEGVAWQ